MIRSLSILLLGTASLGAAKPNVLFIMADDFRPEMGCYGSKALTPNLDKLAKRSVQFDRAYCQQAVCNPSRSSLLTGRRPDTLKLWNNGTHFRELNPDVTTLPLWFKEHGYTTRGVGKIFHNWHTQEKGDRRSWSADEFLHYESHGHDAPKITGELPPNLAKTTTGRTYTDVPLVECRDVPDEAYFDGRVAAEAVRTLAQVKDEAFFLAVGFWKPHAPFNAPKKYWDLYDRAQLPTLNPAKPEGAPEIAFHQSTEILGPVAKQQPLNAEQIAEMRHGYFANISYMDAQVGKVLAALEESGASKNTVVIFFADHGYHIGEHSLWGKTSDFEFDAHVPLLISDPRLENHGQTTQSLAELVDIFPTLVDLCGLPRPEGLDGTSLTPVLADPAKTVKAAAYTQHPRPAYYDREPDKQPRVMGYSVRTADARYTEWRDWKTKEVTARELYLTEQDPAELKNHVDDPKQAATLAAAERLLREKYPR
ncbi:MAG: sulfatase [Verrucomicrobiota bacterium]